MHHYMIQIAFSVSLSNRSIVSTYIASSMFSSALSMSILHQFSMTTLVMFLIGALNFVCSDFMLTGSYFKDGERSKAYRAIYSVFYYVAQFLIAFSIFFLV